MKQNTKSGFLDLLSAGDPDTAATALQLIESGNLKPAQISLILEAAATGVAKLDAPKIETKTIMSKAIEAARHVIAYVSGAKAKAETFKSMTKRIAWRMPPEAVRHFKWELITALNNPDNAHPERLESLAAGAAVLMEERLLAKDHLLDVAETLAEGLGRTTDETRIIIMHERIGSSLDRRLPHHHQRVYEAVFMLTRYPGDVISDVVLQAYINRAKQGAVALEPVVIERMYAIRPQAKTGPFSDGDSKLPNPMRPQAVHATNLAKKPAANRLGAQ